MKNSSRPLLIKFSIGAYATGMLVLILLAASNYPVQWRVQVNHERARYLEVFDQAISYYALDHSGSLFALPENPSMISNSDQCSYQCPALGRTIPCYNLSKQLVPSYMRKILQDPLLTSDSNTGFYINRNKGTLTLGACYHFFKDPIEISHKL